MLKQRLGHVKAVLAQHDATYGAFVCANDAQTFATHLQTSVHRLCKLTGTKNAHGATKRLRHDTVLKQRLGQVKAVLARHDATYGAFVCANGAQRVC